MTVVQYLLALRQASTSTRLLFEVLVVIWRDIDLMPQATIRGIGVIWGDVGVKFNCVERFVGCREVCRVFYEEDSRSYT